MQQNKVLLGISIAAALCLSIAISSCLDSNKQKMKLAKEMSGRFDLEKEINEFKKEKASSEEKVASLTKELEETKSALQAAEKALKEERMVNESLQDTLQKLTKLKEALEKDLKEALLSGKSTATRK